MFPLQLIKKCNRSCPMFFKDGYQKPVRNPQFSGICYWNVAAGLYILLQAFTCKSACFSTSELHSSKIIDTFTINQLSKAIVSYVKLYDKRTNIYNLFKKFFARTKEDIKFLLNK